MKIIHSIQGLFGNTSHYADGEYVGESIPGLWPGTMEHYDGDGNYLGYSEETLTGTRTVLEEPFSMPPLPPVDEDV